MPFVVSAQKRGMVTGYAHPFERDLQRRVSAASVEAMSRMIFVNLPVKDLQRSVDFFAGLGFEFNAQFTDDNATYMVINDQAAVMLLVEEFYATFTTKKIADATQVSEVLVGVSADSREAADQLVDTAVGAGATEAGEPMDMGMMYQRAFYDLDGHKWEIIWMDPDFTG